MSIFRQTVWIKIYFLFLDDVVFFLSTIFSCSIEQTKCIAFHVIQMIKMTELKIDLTFFLARLILICMSETSTA